MDRILGLVDRLVLRHLPPRLAQATRFAVLRRLGAGIGKGVDFGPGVRVLHPRGLVVDDLVTVARDTTLDARGGLRLSEGCLIGFESVILTSTHNSDRVGTRIQDQGMYVAGLVIGQRAWLGTRVVVLPGASIGSDAIVAACSVVSRDIEDKQIVAGVPARPIRGR